MRNKDGVIVDPVDHLWKVYWRAKRRNAGEALKLAQDVADVVETIKRAEGASYEEQERAAISADSLIDRLDGIKWRRRR